MKFIEGALNVFKAFYRNAYLLLLFVVLFGGYALFQFAQANMGKGLNLYWQLGILSGILLVVFAIAVFFYRKGMVIDSSQSEQDAVKAAQDKFFELYSGDFKKSEQSYRIGDSQYDIYVKVSTCNGKWMATLYHKGEVISTSEASSEASTEVSTE